MAREIRCPRCNTKITGVADTPVMSLLPHRRFAQPVYVPNLLSVSPCGHEFHEQWVGRVTHELLREYQGQTVNRLPSPYQDVSKYQEALKEVFVETMTSGATETTRAWEQYLTRVIVALSPPVLPYTINLTDCSKPADITFDVVRDMVQNGMISDVQAALQMAAMALKPDKPTYAAFRHGLLHEIRKHTGQDNDMMTLRVLRWVVRNRSIAGVDPMPIARLCLGAVKTISRSDWEFPFRKQLTERVQSGLIERLANGAAGPAFENCSVDDEVFLIAFLEFVLTQAVKPDPVPPKRIGVRKRRTIRKIED